MFVGETECGWWNNNMLIAASVCVKTEKTGWIEQKKKKKWLGGKKMLHLIWQTDTSILSHKLLFLRWAKWKNAIKTDMSIHTESIPVCSDRCKDTAVWWMITVCCRLLQSIHSFFRSRCCGKLIWFFTAHRQLWIMDYAFALLFLSLSVCLYPKWSKVRKSTGVNLGRPLSTAQNVSREHWSDFHEALKRDAHYSFWRSFLTLHWCL